MFFVGVNVFLKSSRAGSVFYLFLFLISHVKSFSFLLSMDVWNYYKTEIDGLCLKNIYLGANVTDRQWE